MVPGYIINKFIRPTNEEFPNNFFYCVHPSLLPKYRGACPLQHSILNGDSETGVSLIHLSKRKFDAGNIVLQKKFKISPNFNYGNLRDSLAEVGGNLVADLVLGDAEDANRNSILQDNSVMTKAPLFQGKTFNYIDFKQRNSGENLRIFNAFTGSSTTPFSKIYVKKQDRVVIFEDLLPVDENNPNDKRALARFEHLGTEKGEFKWNHKANREQM